MLHMQNLCRLITTPCANLHSQGAITPVVRLAHALDLKKAHKLKTASKGRDSTTAILTCVSVHAVPRHKHGMPDAPYLLSKADTVVIVHCREKKLAAKAQGRRHASSEDESEDEAGEEAEAGSDGEQDPFFQHEDNPFDDPFFRVWPSPLFHLSVLLICLCHCTGEMTAFSIVVQTDVDSAVVTMPVDYKGWSSQ